VPNQSPASPSKLNRNDGNTTPTSSKRLLSLFSSTNVSTQHKKQQHYVSNNRFSLFSNDIETNDGSESHQSDMELESDPTEPTPSTVKPPPPIFIRRINNCNSFCKNIKEVINGENFTCKSSTNGVKLSTKSSDSYRSVIKFLQYNKADFHTYQLKEDRAYRVVLRNLHHTTPIEEIKNELISHGHTPRNVTNVLQRNSKLPLPMFFIDLESALNNKDIFEIKSLHYTKIRIEEPRHNKQTLQCLRCQGFGHTKAYCNHPPKCVRCGDNHLSTDCSISLLNVPFVEEAIQQTTECVPSIKNFNRRYNHKQNYDNRNNAPHPTINVKRDSTSTTNLNSQLRKSYAQATNSNNHSSSPPSDPDIISIKLSSFLDDFKSLINPLISPLTTVINKLIKSNDK